VTAVIAAAGAAWVWRALRPAPDRSATVTNAAMGTVAAAATSGR